MYTQVHQQGGRISMHPSLKDPIFNVIRAESERSRVRRKLSYSLLSTPSPGQDLK